MLKRPFLRWYRPGGQDRVGNKGIGGRGVRRRERSGRRWRCCESEDTMEFQARNLADAIEARLTGRLEFTDHDRLRDIVALLDGPNLRRFVVDVSGLDFIDSAGLGMILILQEEAEQKNIKLVVRGPRDDVKRSIDLAKIGEIVAIEY